MHKAPLAAGSQLTMNAGSCCPDTGCWDPMFTGGLDFMPCHASPGAAERRTYSSHTASDGGEELGPLGQDIYTMWEQHGLGF